MAVHSAGIIYLDMASCKQILHQSPVGTAHTSMMDGKAMRQDGLEVQIIACLSFSLQTQQARLANSCSAYHHTTQHNTQGQQAHTVSWQSPPCTASACAPQ